VWYGTIVNFRACIGFREMLYSVRNHTITFDTVVMTMCSASGVLAHTRPSHCINICNCRMTYEEAFWCPFREQIKSILPSQRLCHSVHLCLSQVGILLKGMGWLNWCFSPWSVGTSFDLSCSAVLWNLKFGYCIYKNKGTSLWNFILKSRLWNFRNIIWLSQHAGAITFAQRWTLLAW